MIKSNIFIQRQIKLCPKFSELCELLNYWKNDNNSKMNETINKSLIKPYLDKFCDQESLRGLYLK